MLAPTLTLTLTMRSRLSTVSGFWNACTMFIPTARMSSLVCTRSNTTVNSSPPSLAAKPKDSVVACKRRARLTSTRSPKACPMLSLMYLKLSMSRKNTPTWVPYRTEQPTTPLPMTTAWASDRMFLGMLSMIFWVGLDGATGRLRLTGADFGATLRDISIERFVNRRIHGRLFIFLERLLPNLSCALGRILTAPELPVLIVLPAGNERPVECMFVPLHRVRFAEEMASGWDAPDGVEAKRLLVDNDWFEELDHHLQHFDVEHQLFEGGGETPFLPTGSVIHEVSVSKNRAPQGHFCLIGALGVGRIGGAGVRCAIGKPVAARQLPACDVGLCVFRRTEGRGSRTHVDVRGERTVHHRGSGPNQLRDHDPKQRFRVLLGKRRRERYRRHGTHEGERRDHHGLAVLRHRDQTLAHCFIEATRAVH